MMSTMMLVKKANLSAPVYLLNGFVVNIHVCSAQLIMSDSDAYGRCGKVSAYVAHKMKACNYTTAHTLLHVSICGIIAPIMWEFYMYKVFHSYFKKFGGQMWPQACRQSGLRFRTKKRIVNVCPIQIKYTPHYDTIASLIS